MAQALAQAAVHDDWIEKFLIPAEKAAGGIGNRGTKTMLQLLDEMRADKKLVESVEWPDSNKISEGVLQRAPEEMIKYASQYTVSADQVEEKLAEMINAVGENPLLSSAL